MVTYEMVNDSLERLHQRYNALYWEHLARNTPLETNDMKSVREDARQFFHNGEVNDFLIQQNALALSDKERRKYYLLLRHFAQKRIEYDETLSKAVNEAADLMCDGAVIIDGRPGSVSELWRKINEAKNEEQLQHYRAIQDAVFNGQKNAILEIVKRRNKLARAEGFASYADLFFSDKDIDVPAIRRYIDGISPEMARRYLDYKKQSDNGSQLHVNFEYHLKKHDVYRHLETMFHYWGIERESPRIHLIDDGERPGHHSSNECIAVSIPDDVRIYVHSDKTCYDYYFSVFHECGHALHFSNIACDDYIFKVVPSWNEEAMASLVDKLLSLPESLRIIAPTAEDVETLGRLNISDCDAVKTNNLLGLSFVLELYTEEPDGVGVDRLYENIVHNLTGKQGNTDWGSWIIGIAKFPFIDAGYLFAGAISNQLISSMYQRFGTYLSPEVYRCITQQCFAPGNAIPCWKMVEQASGSAFDMGYFFSRYLKTQRG